MAAQAVASPEISLLTLISRRWSHPLAAPGAAALLALSVAMAGGAALAGTLPLFGTVVCAALILNIVIPVSVMPELAGLATALIDPGLSLDFLPDLMKWLALAALCAPGSLIYSLGLPFLSLQSHNEEVNYG